MIFFNGMKNMETKKQKRAVGKPFAKGDPRINRSGRPKSIDDLRKLAQSIGDEMVTTEEGERMPLAEVILRSWAKSKEPMLQRAFMEYGYGKPPDKLETNPLEPNTTLILHYGHERERLLLDGDGNDERTPSPNRE
jgi:hypothetical protein